MHSPLIPKGNRPVFNFLSLGHSRQLKDFWEQKFPLLFFRRGGQTTKSSKVQKNKLSCRSG